MLSWIFIIILAYFFFSISSLGDKLVLGQTKSPALYTFYVGMLSITVLIFIPFANFRLPQSASWIWIIVTSISFLAGLYALYSSVRRFEVSRVVPVVGAFQPILILLLSGIFFGRQVMETVNAGAFGLLVAGSVIISLEKKLAFTRNFLASSLSASLLVALGFIFSKIVFLHEPFLQGIIWIGVFSFLFSLTLLFSKKLRVELFNQKQLFHKKTLLLVLGTQIAGGIAGLLQNFAVFLAPVSGLALLNALRGVQYIFLFFITLCLSLLFPSVLKESLASRVIVQKTLSIFIIVAGLALLVLK